MGLIDQIREDVASITSDENDFGEPIIITSPTGAVVNLIGLNTKHHLGVDTDGNRVNAKNASVAFAEKFLTDVSYPVRNSNQEVVLVGHKIQVKDNTGVLKNYRIQQSFPDEEIGLIVCILEDLETE